MNIPPWADRFPRLYDLYLESELGHPNNYFEYKNVSLQLLRHPPWVYYIELEEVLSLMDSDDWNEFKKKTKKYVILKDKWDWHTQLFEAFNEARGYAFLKQQGYSKVHFIPEEQSQKTPDLIGIGNQGVALLEAKRIRDSDDENDELVMSMEQISVPMHEEVHSLSDPLKAKLNSTVRRAETQLYSYDAGDNVRRILFLSIRLDLKDDTNETKQQLAQYLSQVGTDIEIEHRIENDFSYV